MEVSQLSLQNNLNEFVVRIGVTEVEMIREYLSIWNLSLQEFNYYGHFLALDLESFGIIG
jgi:hypothetical protein